MLPEDDCDSQNVYCLQVLATNHVFDILVKAMASGGELQRIDGEQLPPRKRVGWKSEVEQDCEALGNTSAREKASAAHISQDRLLPGGEEQCSAHGDGAANARSDETTRERLQIHADPSSSAQGR